MGTIIQRKRKDGSLGHTAVIRIKRDGKVIHTETQTFDRDQAARAWLKKRETELAQPGALTRPDDPTLADVIDKYIETNAKAMGKTKAQVLRTIKSSDIAALKCSEIGSPQIIEFARSIKAQPQTVGNYLSHLAAVFAVARPAFGYPLHQQAMQDAVTVAKRLGLTARSRERDRRPTLDELDKLMQFYTLYEAKNAGRALPMRHLVAFAIFSTRRQEEITRMVIGDLDRARLRIVVRDMKNPGEKIGNDVPTQLTPEALALIDLQTPAADGRIWPHNAESISASFTRACQMLEIDDLHFHDLRHDGVSRLFELGWSIPQAATVSGHRSWKSLQRYAHIEQRGDKYAAWPWRAKLGF